MIVHTYKKADTFIAWRQEKNLAVPTPLVPHTLLCHVLRYHTTDCWEQDFIPENHHT